MGGGGQFDQSIIAENHPFSNLKYLPTFSNTGIYSLNFLIINYAKKEGLVKSTLFISMISQNTFLLLPYSISERQKMHQVWTQIINVRPISNRIQSRNLPNTYVNYSTDLRLLLRHPVALKHLTSREACALFITQSKISYFMSML